MGKGFFIKIIIILFISIQTSRNPPNTREDIYRQQMLLYLHLGQSLNYLIQCNLFICDSTVHYDCRNISIVHYSCTKIWDAMTSSEMELIPTHLCVSMHVYLY